MEFFNKIFNEALRKSTTYDLQYYAVVLALMHWTLLLVHGVHIVLQISLISPDILSISGC
jgi:hypothetical protein